MDIPALINDVKTPKVLWYQNDITVTIRIMLIGVEDYFLRVDYDSLRFSTHHDDCDYYLWLNLFGTVIPEQTINENKGREILIKLAKAHKWMDWLRLHSERTSNAMIRPDLDHVVVEEKRFVNDDFPPPGSIHDMIKEKYIRINPDVPSSDEDESEDEAMEGWYF